MKRTWLRIAVVGGAAGLIGWRLVSASKGQGTERDRWHTVTIDCEPEQLGTQPPPLGDLGLPIEVRVTPAPGARGTELAVRLVNPPPSGVSGLVAKVRNDDPVRAVRRALREARQLAEVGEVLLPDAPATTHPTLLGAPLAYATRHGREEGRL